MMRRTLAPLVVLVLCVPLLSAQEEAPKKDRFADFSRLIHKVVVKQTPREFEERFGWGNTVPIPDKLRLPGLRTYLKVGDRVELPHGAWRRVRVKLEDANRNLRIDVRDFKKLDKAYRVLIDSEVDLVADGEWNQWQKGLLLLKMEGLADVRIASSMVFDVDVKIDFKNFVPDVKIEPKITDLTLDLKEFNFRRLGGTVEGEQVREIGTNLMRDLLRDLLKAAEPTVRDEANKAIAQSLKEGKNVFPVNELLKAIPPTKDPEVKEK